MVSFFFLILSLLFLNIDEHINFKFQISVFHCFFFKRSKVYDGRGTLEEDETAEARFIKIQAAYELLIDEEKRQDYDRSHRVNPMKVIGNRCKFSCIHTLVIYALMFRKRLSFSQSSQ